MVIHTQTLDPLARGSAETPVSKLPAAGAAGSLSDGPDTQTVRFSPSASDILNLVGDGIISTDAAGRVVVFNRAAEEIFGYAAGEVVGNRIDMLLPERFRHTHGQDVERFARDPPSGTRLMGHRRAVSGLRKNGEEFPLEATLSREIVGEAPILTAVIRDVTVRRQREAAWARRTRELEETGRRLRLTLKAGRMGSWEWRLGSGSLHADPITRRLWALQPGRIMAMRDLQRDDLMPLANALAKAVGKGGEFEIELQVTHPDGSLGWVLVKGEVLFDEDGQARTVVGVTFDITERRKSDELRQLVTSELNHRMKNMLTLINSIISMSGTTMSVEDYKRVLRQRVGAVAQTHRLLLDSGWAGASLAELASAELQAYGYPDNAAITMTGPHVALEPGIGITLGLVLHELGTNAVKYGALSISEGRVHLGWHLGVRDGRRQVLIEWVESGGPTVEEPVRRGFGSTLIERVLTLSGAVVNISYEPSGVSCRIELPLGQEAGVAP
ncbi:PAS domain S-box protein [Aurantimonas sp. A2-1-M11]|uniref:PAS domain S-box protein n=1 Tax=Aurantimonas sp. A2-1-M11 TaxID=3113712 RepID=UPI002F92592E